MPHVIGDDMSMDFVQCLCAGAGYEKGVNFIRTKMILVFSCWVAASPLV